MPQILQWQYQQRAWVPLVTTVVDQTVEWVQPLQFPRAALRTSEFPIGVRPLFETLPAPVQSWQWSYPDRLDRRLAQPALQQTLGYDPLPYPAATLIVAWGFYPDFARGRGVHPALMPTFSYGTLDPIPNPPSTYRVEDRVLLGQTPSIEIAIYPSIGGGATWS